FKDGRPTPLGVRQKARLDKQRGYAIYAKIVKLVREVDFAVERHARIQEKKKEERQEILNNKLKPKGDLLLQIQTDTIKK
ncbi:39S ribosomal protein L52, mitochondrial, partial [Trachymyrmex septentrionalis]